MNHILNLMFGRLWKRLALYFVLVGANLAAAWLSNTVGWSDTVITIAVLLWAIWDIYYTISRCCTCEHPYAAHPNPKECGRCNCDDYDGPVPPMKAQR